MNVDGVRLADKSVNFVRGRVRPLRDQVIVKPLPLKLGDKLAADWQGAPVVGVVQAVGPGCYLNIHEKGFKDGKPYRRVRQSKVFTPTEVKPGDKVHLGGMELGGYLFPQVWIDGAWCVLCREQDVAVLQEA
jgi:hypothetical protein